MKKFSSIAFMSLAFLGFSVAGVAEAKEFGYLQADPRFNGGETNPSNPSNSTFWFYNNYGDARMRLQLDGVRLNAVSAINAALIDSTSETFYLPVPSNPYASTYPASDSELNELKKFVIDRKRTVIINLAGAGSEAMANDVFNRLGLGASVGTGEVVGTTAYPDPNQPVIKGPKGAVGSFTWADTGYTSQLGKLRSLVTVNGKTAIPYVEKGDLTPDAGAFYFILDEHFITDFYTHPVSQQNIFRNLVDYATEDQYLHYIPVTVPEPTSLALLGLGSMAILGRRRRTA